MHRSRHGGLHFIQASGSGRRQFNGSRGRCKRGRQGGGDHSGYATGAPISAIMASNPRILYGGNKGNIPGFLRKRVNREIGLRDYHGDYRCHYSGTISGSLCRRSSRVRRQLLSTDRYERKDCFLRTDAIGARVFVVPSRFQAPSMDVGSSTRDDCSLDRSDNHDHALGPPVRL